jgi:hypothetical protein
MLLVRKSGEETHGLSVEGNRQAKRYIIADDLVDSGRTVRDIMAGVALLTSYKARCYGLYLFRPDSREIRPWMPMAGLTLIRKGEHPSGLLYEWETESLKRHKGL